MFQEMLFPLLSPLSFLFFFLQHSCKLRYLKSVNRLSAARVGLKKKEIYHNLFNLNFGIRDQCLLFLIIKLGIQFGFVSKIQQTQFPFQQFLMSFRHWLLRFLRAHVGYKYRRSLPSRQVNIKLVLSSERLYQVNSATVLIIRKNV